MYAATVQSPQVCSKPITQLTSEIERLPISQARRIPTKAYSHLATHTEDWEYPKLSSVIPRRILSTFPTDLYDFLFWLDAYILTDSKITQTPAKIVIFLSDNEKLFFFITLVEKV